MGDPFTVAEGIRPSEQTADGSTGAKIFNAMPGGRMPPFTAGKMPAATIPKIIPALLPEFSQLKLPCEFHDDRDIAVR